MSGKKYYTAQEHFEQNFQETQRRLAFGAKNVAEFEEWAIQLREELHSLTGMEKMKFVAPKPKVLEETVCDGYIRRKIVIYTEKDIQMPFYLLTPEQLEVGEKRSAIIACHGHSSCGKEAVAGIRENVAVSERIDHYDYNYGEALAKMGYIVLIPDARGFGERRERYEQGEENEQKLSSSCAYLNVMAMSLGQTVTGMWVHDLMSLVDFALEQPFVNGHIGCVGLSGGGLQSLWLAAMDTRIECSVVSGYFYGYLQSLLINFNCLCNYVPNLWNVVDIGDIGALIAPRPMLIETGDLDELNGKGGLKNVTEQVETVRDSMKIWGKEEHLCHHIFSGGHMWNGQMAYPWLLKHLPPKQEVEE